MSYSCYALLFYIIHGHYENPERNTQPAVTFLLYHAVITTAMHTSCVWLTIGVALFRYLYLRAKYNRLVRRMTVVNRVILLTFLLSCVSVAPQAINYRVQLYNDTLTNRSWYYLSSDSYNLSKAFSFIQYVIMAIAVKLLPCILLFILSALLIHRMVGSYRSYLLLHGAEPASPSSAQRNRRRTRQTVKTTLFLLAVVAILAVSELPQGILFVLSSVLYEFYDTVHLQLGNLLDVLALMSGSINFILFCSMSSQFRKTLASTLHLSHTHPNG